jgi:type IV pilus assembly protein PilQ
MIVLNAHSQQQGRRTMPMKAAMYGLPPVCCRRSASSTRHPPRPARSAPAVAPPAAGPTLPSAHRIAVTVTSIDFKRGDGGSGKLILHFDKDGRAPDLRKTAKPVSSSISATSRCPRPAADVERQRLRHAGATQVEASGSGDNGAQLVMSAKGAVRTAGLPDRQRLHRRDLVPRAGDTDPRGRQWALPLSSGTAQKAATAAVRSTDVR